MTVRHITIALILLMGAASGASAACPEGRKDDPDCVGSGLNADKSYAGDEDQIAGELLDYDWSDDTSAADTSAAAVIGDPVNVPADIPFIPPLPTSPDQQGPLTPARAYLTREQIPPKDFGAYGVVSLTALPTSKSRDRLLLVCEAYKAHFPQDKDLPPSLQRDERMLTIWPVKDPGVKEVKADNCSAALGYYDLHAGQSAIADAKVQGGKLDGRGPFLIGWSPSNSRGAPDKLVLIVDLSKMESEEQIDQAFRFWRQKIVDNPTLWKQGFSMEAARLAIKAFVDKHGAEITEAIKLSNLSPGK